MSEQAKEGWNSSEAYELWVGRWSRAVATQFLDWLAIAPDCRWADVGCGTGALSELILQRCQPRAVAGIDRSAGFISAAQRKIHDPRASFQVGDATALPWADTSFNASA